MLNLSYVILLINSLLFHTLLAVSLQTNFSELEYLLEARSYRLTLISDKLHKNVNEITSGSVPLVIISRNYFNLVRRSIKSAHTLGVIIQYPSSKDSSLTHQFSKVGLMSASASPSFVKSLNDTILTYPSDKTNCFLISRTIFQNAPYVEDMDDYFSRIKSVVFDFYSWHRDEMDATLNVKNRHIMLLKVIVAHLNLSFSSCGEDQYPNAKIGIGAPWISQYLPLLFNNKSYPLQH